MQRAVVADVEEQDLAVAARVVLHGPRPAEQLVPFGRVARQRIQAPGVGLAVRGGEAGRLVGQRPFDAGVDRAGPEAQLDVQIGRKLRAPQRWRRCTTKPCAPCARAA